MSKEKKNKKRAEIMSATFAAEVKEPGYYRDHEVPDLKLRVRVTEITGREQIVCHLDQIVDPASQDQRAGHPPGAG